MLWKNVEKSYIFCEINFWLQLLTIFLIIRKPFNHLPLLNGLPPKVWNVVPTYIKFIYLPVLILTECYLEKTQSHFYLSVFML